jgi:UDPglucose 6-dehydrogenase
MRVGFVGLGKLGLPVAHAIASHGHRVVGTDANPAVEGYLASGSVPYREAGLQPLLDAYDIGWRDSIREVVDDSDVVFIAVQTPHDPDYEGVTPAPRRRKDFEYAYLEQAYRTVCRSASMPTTVAVISTVLPGTMRQRIMPQGRNPSVSTVYNPFFIAMGTTVADFLQPEFVIVGEDQPGDADALVELYRSIHDRPIVRKSIESAELVKVAYNGVISAKIVLANWIGEICDKTGADADEVHDALAHATERLWSPRYFRAGMGDGGGCHPRDNIALSWLAERLDLSVDVGGFVTKAREDHVGWLAQMAEDWSALAGLGIVVLGAQYKPDSDLTTGSASRLLADHLGAPLADDPTSAAVYVIGCRHSRYARTQWPTGSVVLDPFGCVPDQRGVVVKRIGRK